MIRYIPLLVAIACASPSDDGGTDTDAIEITGYLDASRISITSLGSAATGDVAHAVIGEPGAAEIGLDVMVLNERTGGYDVAAPADDGSFGLTIDATEGDALTITQGDADPVEVSADDLIDFPELSFHHLLPPNDEHLVLVELEFVEPQHTLDFVMHTLHGAAAPLTHFDDSRHTFTGHIHAGADQWILFHGLDGDRNATRLIELQVGVD